MKSDWDAMHESSRILEEYMREINEEKYHSSQLNTVRMQIDHLNTIQNILEHIFGKPKFPLQKSLVKPQSVWNNEAKSLVENYERSTEDLISSLKVILELEKIPEGLHQLQVVYNNCALQTLELICKYNLAPPELIQKIQNCLKSKQGLEWFSHASAKIFRVGTNWDNEDCWAPYSEIHLKHDFQMTHFYRIFQGLVKKEKDWILFQYLSIGIGPKFEEELNDNDYTTEMGKCQSWVRLVLFTRKLKNFLLKELEGDNQEGSSRRFLMDVRDDVVEMAKMCMNPQDAWVENISLRGCDMCRLVFLQFLHHRLGLKDMSSDLFGDEVGINKVEFEQKFGLLEMPFNIQMWKNMLLDYAHNISECSSQGPKVKKITTKAEKEEMKKFYWKNFQASINAYKEWKARQFETDKSWREKLESNKFYKQLVDELDAEAKDVWALYEDVNFMLQL